MPIRIFAYGSNLCSARLLERAPSAVFLSTGYLPGHSLRFHKRSRDGSAKADAYFTGDASDRVWGSVVEVNAADKRVIDRCEFLGIGYDQQRVAVYDTSGQGTTAWVYVARSAAIDEALKPYCWYRRFVIAGAEEQGLPPGYVRRLQRVPYVVDPLRNRRRRNRRLLAALSSI